MFRHILCLIWSIFRFSSLLLYLSNSLLSYLSFIQMFAKDYLPATFWSKKSAALKQSMERKTLRFWLRSAGYLWRGSIHPFVLCGQGRCGWEFWEVKDLNEATARPPPHPSSSQTCWWTMKAVSASGFWNTVLLSAHTLVKYAHTENKHSFKRDSWPLPPPQVLLLTILLRDKRLSARWPTFSLFRWRCTP